MAIRNFSAEAFGSGGGGSSIPRQKFNFTIVLDTPTESVQFTRVSNVTAPSYSFDTIIANQYNKNRVVQTKLNYDAITVQFYDTFDSQFYNIMRRYIGQYYNGGYGIEKRTLLEGTETINASFETDIGYTPTADRYFFPRLKIIQNGLDGQHREIILINPMITEVRGDTLDYSDSNPVMYTVTFQPESIQSVNQTSNFVSDPSFTANDFIITTTNSDSQISVSESISNLSFDSLSSALQQIDSLPAGQLINIAGVDSFIETQTDGSKILVSFLTGATLQ